MKKINFKVIAVLLTALYCAGLTACGTQKGYKGLVKAKDYEKNEYKDGSPASGVITQNDRFLLEWNDDDKRVIIHDLKYSNSYSTVPNQAIDENKIDENGLPVKNNPRIESAISVTYYDEISAAEQPLYSYNAAVKNGRVFAYAIKNGIRVVYDFTEKKITVPVDYTIGDEAFKISVETSEISDSDKYTVTGVSIAPFICGIKNDFADDGYLFLPDGSGAIITPKTIDSVGIYGSIPVYGGDFSIRKDKFDGYAEQCYMPVYGMKNGNGGLCAIIDSSAERAFINYSIGSSNIGYSSVYSFFRIKSYNLIDSPLKKVSDKVMSFNGYMTDEALSVSYYPMSGSDCGYNDMANIYRNYLIENCGLKKINSDNYRLSLEIEGGIENKKFFCGVPYTGLTALTNVEQAKSIAEYFSDVGDGLLIRLCGFTESGLNVGKAGGGFKINPKLGGKKEISALVKYCRSKKITVSLDFDPISFNRKGNGYSVIKSSAEFSDGQSSYINDYNNVTGTSNGTRIYLMSRSLIPQLVEKLAEKTENYGFDAMGLGKFGSFVYSDFSNPETYNCNNIQENTAEIIKNSLCEKKVVLTGANDYAACAASHVTGVPTGTSNFDFYSADIPFYTMVFKGYVSMSSKAVNLSPDPNNLLLSCVEAGISPTYTLIYDFTQDAINSSFTVTRSSDFVYTRDGILRDYNKTKGFYEAVSSATMIEHRIISNQFRRVEYDNGVTLYINYGDKDIMFDDVNVPANDFTVIGV